MIMIPFVKLVTYLFVCKVEGDVRSDEESGPEEEKAEINKVDGVLDNKKKLQWRNSEQSSDFKREGSVLHQHKSLILS